MPDIESLVLDLYRSAQDSEFKAFRNRALALLGRVTPFDSARWGSGVEVSAAGIATRYTYLYNEPPDMIAAYAEVSDQDHIPIGTWSGGAGLRSFRTHSRTHYAAPEYRGIRDYHQRYGHENVLVVGKLHEVESCGDYIGLYRRDDRAQFGVDDEHLAQTIFPHCLEALRINAALNVRTEATGAIKRVTRAGIADSSGTILYAEPGTRELLESEGRASRCDKLSTRIMEALASSIEASYRGTRTVVRGSFSQGMLFFRVRPICAVDALSARELEVARLMAEGATSREVASRLGLSPETVRAHLRHIYGKLGVSSRAELVLELMRSA